MFSFRMPSYGSYLQMNLLSFFTAVAAVAVVPAMAETSIPEAPSAPPLRPVSGSFKAGYSTNYEFRGLIPTGCNTTAPVRLDWRSDLTETYSFVLGLKQEMFLSNPAIDMKDETVLDLGLQRKLDNATYLSFGGRASYGGLAGLVSDQLFGNTPAVYESAVFLRHDLSLLPGFYVEGSAAYAFAGVTGWWFDMCLGSDSRLTEKLYLGFKFGSSLSASYWPAGSNGWQSLYVRVTAKYRLYRNVSIEPFVGLHWLGNGAHGLNRDYGKRLVKGNGWVAGVSLVYSF